MDPLVAFFYQQAYTTSSFTGSADTLLWTPRVFLNFHADTSYWSLQATVLANFPCTFSWFDQRYEARHVKVWGW